MALSKIEQVIASLAGEYATRTGQAIPFHFGILERDKHHKPPCVVWLPQPGTVIPPKPMASGNARLRAPSLWDKSHVLRFECWAANSGDAEALHDNVLALLAKTLKGSLDVGAWGWVTQEQANSGFNIPTSKIYQTVTIWIPVLDQARPLVDIAAVSSQAILGDDWTGEEAANG